MSDQQIVEIFKNFPSPTTLANYFDIKSAHLTFFHIIVYNIVFIDCIKNVSKAMRNSLIYRLQTLNQR